MGLVEAGVGLIPGGGGCKEMVLRSIEAGSSIRPDARGEGVEIFEGIKKNFETIAKATVSTSAAEARGLGFLRHSDSITVNRERLVTDAKLRARALADAGYTAPVPRNDIPAPGESVLATLKLAVWTMREGQYISDHDVKVANWIAYALAGGKVAPGTPVSEQYLLDLEREAFVSLCGEEDAGENRIYIEDRQAAKEFSRRGSMRDVVIASSVRTRWARRVEGFARHVRMTWLRSR